MRASEVSLSVPYCLRRSSSADGTVGNWPSAVSSASTAASNCVNLRRILSIALSRVGCGNDAKYVTMDESEWYSTMGYHRLSRVLGFASKWATSILNFPTSPTSGSWFNAVNTNEDRAGDHPPLAKIVSESSFLATTSESYFDVPWLTASATVDCRATGPVL